MYWTNIETKSISKAMIYLYIQVNYNEPNAKQGFKSIGITSQCCASSFLIPYKSNFGTKFGMCQHSKCTNPILHKYRI